MTNLLFPLIHRNYNPFSICNTTDIDTMSEMESNDSELKVLEDERTRRFTECNGNIQ